MEDHKLQWSALEYEHKDRGRDWFWALGVIVLTSSAAAFLYGDYFFTGLLVLGGVLLGFLAIKKPEDVFYELNHKGFQVGSTLYPYENIKSFWVQKMVLEPEPLKPTLFIKSERFFLPIISVPIDADMAGEIRDMMLHYNVQEEEMKEHVSIKIMEVLGF